MFPSLYALTDIPDITLAATSTVAEQGNAIINYTVDAFPDATVLPTLMRLDSSPMPMLMSITADSITLFNVLRQHAGTYTVSSTNEAGTGTINFETVVLCKIHNNYYKSHAPQCIIIERQHDTLRLQNLIIILYSS